jgi:hypothetical protein
MGSAHVRAVRLKKESKPIEGQCCTRTPHRQLWLRGKDHPCGAPPAYEIDGKKYCFGHAGQKALSILANTQTEGAS